MPNKIAVNRLAHQNLQSILDDGCNGKLPDMSKEDWILLEHLIAKYGETSYNRGRNKGTRDEHKRSGYHSMETQLDLFDGIVEEKE